MSRLSLAGVRFISSRSPPCFLPSGSKANPAEAHTASAASNNALFYPRRSFEMLKEAQQEEASRLGSKSPFDSSLFLFISPSAPAYS